jgi:hypothetical protein
MPEESLFLDPIKLRHWSHAAPALLAGQLNLNEHDPPHTLQVQPCKLDCLHVW